MKNCVSKAEGHREIIQGFQNLRKGRRLGRLTDRHSVINSVYENPTLIYLSRTVCNSFLSVTHGLYSSLSATIDCAWGASKLLYSWYRLTFVGEIVRWLALAIQCLLAPRLRKFIALPLIPLRDIMACSSLNLNLLPARRVRRSLLQYIM
jgi:hypothetical protein